MSACHGKIRKVIRNQLKCKNGKNDVSNGVKGLKIQII